MEDKNIDFVLKDNYRQRTALCIDSVTAGMAVKVYAEQCPGGFNDVFTRIKTIDTNRFICVGIIHDDEKGKPHLHIMVKPIKPRDRFRVKAKLKELNIVFRPIIDDELLKNKGLETIGHVSAFATYILHQTPSAIAAGKKQYTLHDLASNVSNDTLQEVLEHYDCLTKRKTKKEVFDELCKSAYDAGEKLISFRNWETGNLNGVLSEYKKREVMSWYHRGFDKIRNEPENAIDRLALITAPYYYSENNDTVITKRFEKCFELMGVKSYVVNYQASELLDMPDETDALIILSNIKINKPIDVNSLIESKPSILMNSSLWRGQYLIFIRSYYGGRLFEHYEQLKSACWQISLDENNMKMVFKDGGNENRRVDKKVELYKTLRDYFNSDIQSDYIKLDPEFMNS